MLANAIGVMGECDDHSRAHFLVRNRNPGIPVVSKPETESPWRPPKSASSIAKFFVFHRWQRKAAGYQHHLPHTASDSLDRTHVKEGKNNGCTRPFVLLR